MNLRVSLTMAYTEFDRACDEAALGYSFSRRTRLLVWVMKWTWPLWRRSERVKTWLGGAMARTLLPPRKPYERPSEVSYRDYARTGEYESTPEDE